MRLKRKIIFIIYHTVILAFLILAIPLSLLANEGGTVKGSIKTLWVKTYKAVVYIDRIQEKEFPPPKENPFLTMKGFVFKPRILPIVKGSTVDFINDDKLPHNVFAAPGSAKSFDLGILRPGVKKSVTFDKLGEVILLCIGHQEMFSYVIVLQNPYFVFTDKKGNFEINDILPGKYQLKLWHEKFKDASQEVVIEGRKTVSIVFNRKQLKKR